VGLLVWIKRKIAKFWISDIFVGDVRSGVGLSYFDPGCLALGTNQQQEENFYLVFTGN